ncbi:MAG: hypothetical protein HRT35_33720, partial [Algicola sp.]|nr:hypothetical protein [Algicola sp.]
QLAGHSFGAKVALELAIQLQRQGDEVAVLVVMGAPAPSAQITPQGKDWDDCQCLVELAKAIGGFLGKDLNVHHDTLLALEPDQRLSCFRDCLVAANWLIPQTPLVQIRGLVDVFAANVSAEYLPKMPDKIAKLVLLKGKDEPKHWDIQDDPNWGWQNYATTVFEHDIPGDHSSVFYPPQVAGLVAVLQRYMRA